jgi:UDP-N-acetyl-D-galactosamine dehydrogenase
MEETMASVAFKEVGVAKTVGVIGLGYVSLPLAVASSAKYHTVNESCIIELRQGHDHTDGVSDTPLAAAAQLTLTGEAAEQLRSSDFFVVAAPTPVDDHEVPDLSPVFNATKTIAAVHKKGDIVVCESTAYLGVTEELCPPMLAKLSGLIYNKKLRG